EVKNNLISNGQLTIDMTGILVDDIEDPEDNADLLAHLKSDDFFNVEEFPEATITFKGIQGEGQEQLMMGEMTIKGVRNTVRFDASIRQTMSTGLVAKTDFMVDRTVHGITYKSKSVDQLLDKFIYDKFQLQTKFDAFI